MADGRALSHGNGDAGVSAVPAYDLRPQHAQIGAELDAIWRDYAGGHRSYILGDAVQAFEAAFAAYTGIQFCVTVGNGTDALELAMRALGIGPGHEVILPTNTFAATAMAVARIGALPVFADVDERTSLLTVDTARPCLTANTRAIIPVHLYGRLVPMDGLLALVSGTRIALLEDAAQAHGARLRGHHAGSFGDAAAISFYPTKNLGALGDAGAVLTNHRSVADHVRMLRNYGSRTKYSHETIGFNSRLDALQASVLSAKLPFLDQWNAARATAAAYYRELVQAHPQIRTPPDPEGTSHAWHQYVVHVPNRDRVRERLTLRRVESSLHYPLPLHQQPAFGSLGYRAGDFPVAERLARQLLSLPIYPGITVDQQAQVAAALVDAVASA